MNCLVALENEEECRELPFQFACFPSLRGTERSGNLMKQGSFTDRLAFVALTKAASFKIIMEFDDLEFCHFDERK